MSVSAVMVLCCCWSGDLGIWESGAKEMQKTAIVPPSYSSFYRQQEWYWMLVNISQSGTIRYLCCCLFMSACSDFQQMIRLGNLECRDGRRYRSLKGINTEKMDQFFQECAWLEEAKDEPVSFFLDEVLGELHIIAPMAELNKAKAARAVIKMVEAGSRGWDGLQLIPANATDQVSGDYGQRGMLIPR